MDSDEVAICRVCRSEATETEPLFHPCKCSGSIKFVHQQCLEEWLTHSNKKYCELCGHEYAFTPLYDPNMPESIPKRIIVRQMLANLLGVLGTGLRWLVVVNLWLVVLPYIVYWLTRFYFWSGQSFVPNDSVAATVALYSGDTDATNATMQANSAGAVITAGSRFVDHASWREWYLAVRDNNTIGEITSYTGVLEGATNTALLLYSLTSIVVKVWTRLAKRILGISISEENIHALVEVIVEGLAKCVEGGVITVFTVLAFLALFLLRDWIVINMPAPDDLVDQVEQQINNNNIAIAQDRQRLERLVEERLANADNRLEVQGQPLIAENPQHRPLFERRPLDVPVLDDLPPNERPIGQQPEEQPAIQHHEEEQHTGWAYAEEAFVADVDGPADGSDNDDMPDITADSTGKHSADNASDQEDVSRPSSACGDHSPLLSVGGVDTDRGKGKGKGKERAPTQSSASDDAWSFVFGESSSSASGSGGNTDPGAHTGAASAAAAAGARNNGPEPDNDMPPTFTTENSQGLVVHAEQRLHENPDNGNARDDEDQWEDESDDDEEVQRQRQLAVLREFQRARQMEGLHLDHLLRPNPGPNPADPQQPRQQPQRRMRLRQQEANADAPVPNVGNRNQVLGEQEDLDGDQNQPDPALDPDFVDFEGADGLLEAMGFRGPITNAIQYFILVLVVVALILALGAWIPYVTGRAVLASHPIRLMLYPVHACIEVIDITTEFVVDTALPMAWVPVRPVFATATNLLGPVLLPVLSLAFPGLRESLAGTGGGASSLWDSLASPSVRSLLLEELRQSWIIELLFPWVSTAATGNTSDLPTKTAPDSIVAGAADAYVNAIDIARNALDSIMPGMISQASAGVDTLLASAQRGLDGISQVPDWEKEIWSRFIEWGVPIDKVSVVLQNAAVGRTLHDRLVTIGVGHTTVFVMCWFIVRYTPRILRHTLIYTVAHMLLLMLKVIVFVTVELVMFPIMCGFCLDVSLLPLQAGSSIASRIAFLAAHTRLSLFLHWMFGMVFMYHFANFVAYCREVLRPGLLWFIRDPNDPQFRPMRDILEGSLKQQMRKIWTGAIMYFSIIFVCFGLTFVVLTSLFKSVYPMHWGIGRWPENKQHLTTRDLTAGLPIDLLFLHFLLPVAIAWGRPLEILGSVFRHWWRAAAGAVRLTEFVIGERNILDEGRWIINGIPAPLPKLWMPVGVVQTVFTEFESTFTDEARTGTADGALPTDEYRRRLQNAIDEALLETHPDVRFILDGQNVRAPSIDTVPIVHGRRMIVPVDGHGRPTEDKYDYEAADGPNREVEINRGRNIPPQAPEDRDRDLRYKAENYRIIHVPPMFSAHMVAYMALTWLAMGLVIGVVLTSSIVIGRAIYSELWGLDTHDIHAFALGLLVVLVTSAIAHWVVKRAAELLDRGTDRPARLRELWGQASRAWATTWKLVVTGTAFYVVVPAIYGIVLEVYLITVVRQYLQDAGIGEIMSRTLRQVMLRNWLFSILQLRVIVSLLHFMPDLFWSREMDRLFTGPPHTWHVMRGLYVFALPAIALSLVSAALPIGLTSFIMWRSGSLDAETFASIFELEDIELLAWSSKVIMIASAVCGAAFQGIVVYKRWSRYVRDRAYLVGQQLLNVDGTGGEANGRGPQPDNAEEIAHADVVANNNNDENDVAGPAEGGAAEVF